jgi:endoglucanase
VGQGIVASGGTNGILDYYNGNAPHAGDYAVYWTGANQYEAMGFDFSPNLDLSLLPDHEYQLSFWVRGSSPGSSFDIRFIDTKTGATDHPWRMGKTIDANVVSWDGQWHQVTLSLKDLEEKGAWDDAWFNPENKFDWAAVDRFEIVAEQKALTGIQLFFDDIKLVGDEIPEVLDAEDNTESLNVQFYPNPLSGNSEIEFYLKRPEHVVVTIYNQQGRVVRTLLDKEGKSGRNTVQWNGFDGQNQAVANGLYFVRVSSEKSTKSARVVVVNK